MLLQSFIPLMQKAEELGTKIRIETAKCFNNASFLRIFNHKGVEVKRAEFTTAGNYVTPQREGSFELYGDRVLKLGTNM